MTTVQQIYDLLDKIAPFAMKGQNLPFFAAG
jgi:hypothetical protein